MDARIPKSTRILLPVMIKVANPAAVAALVSRFVLPRRWIIRESAFTLLPCCLNSWWNFVSMKMQFSTTMTINKGGMIAVSIVTL